MSVSFAYPWALALLLLIPAWLRLLRRRGAGGVAYAPAPGLAAASGRGAAVLGALPDAARGAAFALLVVALAAPRLAATEVEEEADGIAIMMVVDVSSSMLAEDFRPRNRLGASKQAVARFVQGRRNDRIGLVAFAGEALTRVPPTVDHGVLAASLDNLRVGELADGTAIGEGIGAAVNRLRTLEGESRVVILLSDGENNRGRLDPRDAAAAAAALGIRIYTIGVGSDTTARLPVAITPAGLRYATVRVGIDEPLLTEIAQVTGGRYFRAREEQALQRIYDEIDRMETSPVRVRRFLRERLIHLPFLLGGMALLLAEWLFRATRWGRVP